jgi:UDP-3-O-[3-hydroxymyristoyl] glucosamine N-acyltransferase
MKTASLGELAALVDGTVSGDDRISVTALNSLDLAEAGELTFINAEKMADQLAATDASACIAPTDIDDAEIPLIRVDNVDLAAARIHNYLLAEEFQAAGIHDQAVIGGDCAISEQVSIGASVSIGDRVRIGDRVKIEPGAVLGDDVRIGDDCVLHANTVVAHGCSLGSRVTLHHGAVIGSDGFGFATDPATGAHVSKPQVGTVRIDDDVQIGANSCVDRAAFGITHVKSGVPGSSTLGRNVVMGARAAVGGHIHLDDGVMVAALAGVHNNQKKGAVVGGVPAFDVKKWGRASAAFTRLPDMVKEVRRLRKEIDKLTRGDKKK